MSREIRNVPPGWQHPTRPCPHSPWAGGCDRAKANGGQCYRPLYDRSFQEAAREWLDAAIAWDNGTHPDLVGEPERKADFPFFWQWDGDTPDEESYRPYWTPEEATAYQMYETVSEGTPVSPVFATLDELREWLIARGHSPTAAAAFIESRWAPSMMMSFQPGKPPVIAMGVDSLDMDRTHA